MSNTSAILTTGSVRLTIPSKESASAQRDVISSVPMMTNKGRENDYKKRLKESQKE